MRFTSTYGRMLPLLAVSCLVFAGCGKKGGDDATAGKTGAPQATPVNVTPVSLGSISQKIPVTGNLAALQDVQLSAKQTGRVVTVTVREGDVVRAGQLIAQQDTTDLEANVQRDRAALASDVVKVSQAITAYKIQVTQAKQNVINARATLNQYQQAYLKEKRGSRPQEILQSQSTVLQNKANMDNAKITLGRNKVLYQQGAIAKADLDTAQTTYDVDTQQYQNALQAYSLTKEGNREEDIAAAEAQVQQQEANLKNQIANLNDVSSKQDDITAARAVVEQAKATVAYDQVQVQNCSVTSPINGIVASRDIDPGQVATSGTNLMRIVNVDSVYYQPTISETSFSDTEVGKTVDVQVDAFPGKSFNGKVVAIYPAAGATDRNFTLRVDVSNPNNVLRPGMFARGQIITASATNVPVIPATALVTNASDTGFAANTSSIGNVTSNSLVQPSHVFVVTPDLLVRQRAITLGISTMDRVQVLTGLTAGDRIVTTGQQTLKDGDKVSIQNTASASSNSHVSQSIG